MEELSIGNMTFQTFDVGGHVIARRLWREYYADVDAIVFLVDSVDRERFDEVKVELDVLIIQSSARISSNPGPYFGSIAIGLTHIRRYQQQPFQGSCSRSRQQDRRSRGRVRR